MDALLAGYAAGSLSAPLHALVAGHLALVPQSRIFVRSLEAANAAALEKTPPVPISDRKAKLQAIFADESSEPVPADPATDDVLPAPLVRYFGAKLDEIAWRTLLPGVKEYQVGKTERGKAALYCVRRGRRMPAHTHEGSEYTLVLKGGFQDVTGHYRRGDIAIADQEVDHRPQSDDDEDCVCYTVTDGPLRLTGPIGRLLQGLSRLS